LEHFFPDHSSNQAWIATALYPTLPNLFFFSFLSIN
jgi:hypothetical protein